MLPSENKKWELVNFCEFDKYATKSYCAIHNVDESKNLGDITKVDENKLQDFNMICGGSPCFVAGTKVYTSEGYKNIEDVKVGDMVLTHKNRFKKVLKIGMNKNKEIYRIKAQGIFDTFVTGNHPYYIREMKYIWDNKSRMYRRHFSEPIWKEVQSISKNDFIGIPIMSTFDNTKKLTKEECYLIGRYVADGYIRNSKRLNRDNSYNHQVIFCIGKHKIDDFKNHINKSGYYYGINEERTAFKVRIINEHFMNLCIECGKGAENKTIPYWILNLPTDYLKEFLNGYMSGDGCFTNKNYKATSVSRQLIELLGLCVLKCYKVGFRVYYTKRKPKTVIEERVVNQKDSYEIVFTKDVRKQKKYEVIDDIVWLPIKNVSKLEVKSNVYNIEVEEDNSYTANNAIVHNCQDFSVAGKQKGSVWTCNDCTCDDGKSFEYNPLTVHWSKRDYCPNCGSKNIEKTRSSLIVEYLRVVRANKPNFGIYENVKNIVGKQFKDTTFKLFTDELEEYGYNVYWKVLNAKHFGIPQNRERVYLIFIRKDLDNGKFKFPEPFDNGLRLKDMLEDEVDEKFYISDDKVKRLVTNLNDSNSLLYDPSQVKREGKSREYTEYAPTLTSRDYKDPRLVNENAVKQVGNISASTGAWNNPQVGRVYDPNGCSPTLNTCSGGGHEPKVLQVGKINSSQDGVIVDPKGISPTHTACHGNTPKVLMIGNCNPSGNGMNGNVYSENGLSPTLTTNKGEGNKVAIKQATKQGYIECELGGVADLSYPDSKTRRGRVQDNGNTCPTITATETGVCRIEDSLEGSCNKLTHAEWKQKMYKKFVEDADGDINSVCLNQSQTFGYTPPVKGYSKTLKANTHDIGIVNGIRIRKLTPRETFRLMGFSDKDFNAAQNAGISNSQLYKQAGNSIVVDVLYYIYRELYIAMPYLFDDLKLSSFFSGIGAFETGLDRLYKDINSGNFTSPQTE